MSRGVSAGRPSGAQVGGAPILISISRGHGSIVQREAFDGVPSNIFLCRGLCEGRQNP